MIRETVTDYRKLDITERSGVIMLDGAYGSNIIGMGLAPGRPPDEWNITEPDKVRMLHSEYIDAGSSIITTNTFGSNAVKLGRSGLSDRVHELNLRGARIAREVADKRALVAGDIGPTGELLEPYGTLTAESAKKSFIDQAKALFEGGADLIIIETMYDLREALLALEAGLEATPLPVVVSLSFERKETGFVTIMGNRVESSFTELANAGACVVGANCSISSSDMVDLVRVMVDSTSLPVVAQPNAGLPSVEGGNVRYETDPVEFACDIMRMIDIGAKVVGGCCGTNPEFMRVLREKLDERENGNSSE
ncbi:MAG: homocysteine S-methyltransferase family protein [Candidatus Glassbacteria bacterium]